MARRQRLTNNSDETDIASLFSGDTVFAIPYFQRAYKWKLERLQQLNQDLLNLVDETSDFHFLGAIIIHGRRSNPADPDVYDVIDGQQRITTIFLYLCAVVRVLSEQKQLQEAAGLFLKYLAIGRETRLASNSKLHSCKDDRQQLNVVFEDIFADEGFTEQVAPFAYRPLPATGSDKGRLRSNYRAAVRFFEDQYKQEGLDRVRSLYKALLESISVVQIDVWDPTHGPKIFDALNSRQEPMTEGDLVRNEVFARVVDKHPEEIDRIDEQSWQPFYEAFKSGDKSLFDDYFFPFGLTQNPNLRKSDVYSSLKTQWKDLEKPEDIITLLREYQAAFLDAARGTNLQALPPSVALGLRRLWESRAPSSAYPFLMLLSNALKAEEVSQEDGEEVLAIVESFLVRRAICGHEPTGLHAVFKRLWNDCEGHPNKATLTAAIQAHRTVAWPNSDDVARAIRERPFYGSKITHYLLLELNRSRGGDQPGEDTTMWIEHVLPENPVDAWWESFPKADHERMKDLLANLLPLSREMNATLGNRIYVDKRTAYREDSAFKIAREFAVEYEEWTPGKVRERGELIALWAIQRWSH